jgi:hypothetical protein
MSNSIIVFYKMLRYYVPLFNFNVIVLCVTKKTHAQLFEFLFA